MTPAALEKPLTGRMRADGSPVLLRAYEAAGGYQGLRKALGLSPKDIQGEIHRAKLRGRGGGGFDTGVKMGLMPPPADLPGERYVVANADEMEPGTMKDRWLMEGDPHQLIEGLLIAALAVEAQTAFLFIRGEYGEPMARLQQALGEAAAAGYVGANVLGSGRRVEVYVHPSAGRYICGEETGLLGALEGRRAVPRAKPPFPVVSGLWGRPTLIDNVETLCNLPHILARGAAWYLGLSLGPDGGTKLFGVSGRVKRPGLWELPMGTPLREILFDHAGGMADGLNFRALLPGGASTNFLLDAHLDVAMDFASVEKAGSRLGTGTMIVLDDRTCPVGMLLSMERFFARESCGWCTPCREGLPWVANTLEAIEDGRGEEGDLQVLADHVRLIKMSATFCALAPGAMEPLRGAMQYFRDDFERHVREKRCPWK
ncbi:MAG: SLBB domain-containing protein [Planctomycetota bacterium]|nr:SLBB domain-containing protein [Planctomycetota bacterium]